MRVMVALEDRFVKTRNGNIYSNTIYDYSFWNRYLQVFDEVVVLARVCDVAEEIRDGVPANGPGVSFFALPYYVGVWQYIRQHLRLVASMKRAISCADVFILRIPGRIGTLLWHQLMAKKIPYAVEVIGSSADSGRTSGANYLVRGVHKLLRGQKEECEHASIASYVTRNCLQSLYPAGCWSTSCSEVNLPDEAIVDEIEQAKRVRSIREAAGGHRPFRIFHAGTMTALYKAQDVLIEAVSICLSKGLNVELTLLGDGRYRKYFEDRAESLGIAEHVFFLDRLPSAQAVRSQFDRSDIFVLPSLTEGQPRVLIEAMARGLPCIGSKVGGIPELLEPEYLVAAGDAKSLANKIIEVSHETNRLERTSNRNLEESKKYRAVVVNQQRLEFYRRVAELVDSRALRK